MYRDYPDEAQQFSGKSCHSVTAGFSSRGQRDEPMPVLPGRSQPFRFPADPVCRSSSVRNPVGSECCPDCEFLPQTQLPPRRSSRNGHLNLQSVFGHLRPTPFVFGSAAQASPLRCVTRATANRCWSLHLDQAKTTEAQSHSFVHTPPAGPCARWRER